MDLSCTKSQSNADRRCSLASADELIHEICHCRTPGTFSLASHSLDAKEHSKSWAEHVRMRSYLATLYTHSCCRHAIQPQSCPTGLQSSMHPLLAGRIRAGATHP